jgi:hypothetical protein
MSDDKSKPEFIENPHHLTDKAKVVVGRSPEELFKLAEARVEKLKDEFVQILKKECDRLLDFVKKTESPDAADRAAGIKGLRRVSHELRGQGGTFGYPLVSQIGDSLVKYLDANEVFNAPEIKILHAHVDAIRAVSAADIKGDGGDVGRALLGELSRILDKVGAAT